MHGLNILCLSQTSGRNCRDRTFVASKAALDHGIPGLPVYERQRAAASAITERASQQRQDWGKPHFEHGVRIEPADWM